MNGFPSFSLWKFRLFEREIKADPLGSIALDSPQFTFVITNIFFITTKNMFPYFEIHSDPFKSIAVNLCTFSCD